jgi:hypothetical protein
MSVNTGLPTNAERSAHVTMMNLALLPDWNSLDSVRSAHSNLELAALVFFALLVVFDVLAHFAEEHKDRARLFEKIGLCFFAVAVLCEIAGYRYGQRNDALSDQKIRSLDAVAHDADSTAKGAKTTADGAKTKADAVGVEADQAQGKIAAVNSRADLLNAQIAATQYAFSMRNLPSLASRDQVIEQLKQFRGKTVFVRSYRYMGDVDGFRVCKMVIDLAHSAGINPVDQCSTLLPGETPSTGIQVCGPNDQEMLSLSKALTPIDIGGTCPWGNTPHSPDLLISVGSKALMGIGETFQTEDAAKRRAAMKKSSKLNAKR